MEMKSSLASLFAFLFIMSNLFIATPQVFAASSMTSSAGINGSITPLGTTVVPTGGTQEYKIMPNSGFKIFEVLVDGVIQNWTYPSNSIAYPYTVLLWDNGQNRTISVNFEPASFKIVSSAGPNGNISPMGTTSPSKGSTQTYTIIPDEAYRIADVFVDGSSVGPVSSYTFSNITAEHTISASFTLIDNLIGNVLPGWNLIGWTYLTQVTAEELGASISGVDVVSKFDNTTQTWVSHIVGFPLNNFTINFGDGVFMHKQ